MNGLWKRTPSLRTLSKRNLVLTLRPVTRLFQWHENKSKRHTGSRVPWLEECTPVEALGSVSRKVESSTLGPSFHACAITCRRFSLQCCVSMTMRSWSMTWTNVARRAFEYTVWSKNNETKTRLERTHSQEWYSINRHWQLLWEPRGADGYQISILTGRNPL